MSKPKPMALTPANYAASCLPAGTPGAKCETRRKLTEPTLFDMIRGKIKPDACRWKPGDVFYWSNEPIEWVAISHSLTKRQRQQLLPEFIGKGVALLHDGARMVMGIPARVKYPAVTGKRWPGRVLPPEWARPDRWRVTAVRAQRLGDMTDADAIREGAKPCTIDERDIEYDWAYPGAPDTEFHMYARDAYRAQWTVLHGKCDPDAWVWAIAYERIA